MERPLRAKLAAILVHRHGAFLRSEALAAGYTESQVRTHLEAATWHVLHPAVYAERGTVEQARCGDRLPVLMAEALVLSNEDAVMSHGSAVRWHELCHLRHLDARAQATWPPGKTPWVDGEINVHSAGLPRSHVLSVGGVRVTTVARTVADVARNFGFVDGMVVGNSALSMGKVTRAGVEEVLATMYRWPGVRRARQVVACLDARAQNPLESLCLARWWQGGLPRPELQVWVYDEFGFVGIVDGLWLHSFVVYEVDGAVKYTSLGEEDTLLREKVRQERLETAGLVVRRFTWDQLWQIGPDCVSRIRQAFAEAATRPPPRVQLYIGDRDTPSPAEFGDPHELGLCLAYNGLQLPRHLTA